MEKEIILSRTAKSRKFCGCNRWAGTSRQGEVPRRSLDGRVYADSPLGTPYGGQKRKPNATDQTAGSKSDKISLAIGRF
jgi:hypothetical protein